MAGSEVGPGDATPVAAPVHRRDVPEVAIIIPTFNEVQNVQQLVPRLTAMLSGLNYEVIFVDDHSPDGTAAAVRSLSAQNGAIRVIERFDRRGLSTAVIEGLMATSAAFGIVMDGDLQHDETLVPAMIRELQGGCDLVVATRYAYGGSTGDWDRTRKIGSRIVTALGKFMSTAPVSDPMSGFFGVSIAMFRHRAGQLTGRGYKILMDLLCTSGPPIRVVELPYRFQLRQQGESKFDMRVAVELAELFIMKLMERFLPASWMSPCAVAVPAAGMNLLILGLLRDHVSFAWAEGAAALVAAVATALLGKWLFGADRHVRGCRPGSSWMWPYAAAIGVPFANISIAVSLYHVTGATWYVSALVGIAAGLAWTISLATLL